MKGFAGTLDRYVLLRMAGTWGLCLATFVLLFLVVDGFSRMDDFLDAREAFEAQGLSVWGEALKYYATKIPRIVALVGPYMTLFSGIATLVSLARTNEIVPMLSAGRSIHRVLLPVYAFGVLAAATLVLFEESIVPRAVRENEMIERLVKDEGKVEVKKVPHIADGENRFSARRWHPREYKLEGVDARDFVDPSGVLPRGTLEARELIYRHHRGTNGWYPVDGTLRPAPATAGGPVPPVIHLPPDRPIGFSYSPQLVDVLARSGEDGLDRKTLEAIYRQFPSQHRWAVDLHTRTARPVASFVLLLLGIPFVASPEKRSVAWGLGLALAVCVAFFGVDFLFREMGMRGQMNPAAAVWMPPILFTAFAAAMMDRVVT